MNGNKIIAGENNIVAGSNITVSNVSNTFVRSNSAFSPQVGNAFYANATNGVGINTTDPKVAFDSYGAVQFGDIANNKCNEDNQ